MVSNRKWKFEVSDESINKRRLKQQSRKQQQTLNLRSAYKIIKPFRDENSKRLF